MIVRKEKPTLPPLVTNTLTALFVTASKELVDALLALNTNNRAIKESNVARIRNEIESGDFIVTGDAIEVTEDGWLGNGQHRLEAIKAAGYPPVVFLLVTGLSSKSQAVRDRGVKRNLADALNLLGEHRATKDIVAVANIFVNIVGALDPRTPFSHADAKSRSDSATSTKVYEWIDEMVEVQKAIGGRYRAPVIAACVVYWRHDKEGCLKFCEQMKTGVNLQETDPAYRLRDALSREKLNGFAGSLRAFKLTVGAVVAHSQNLPLKLMKETHSWDGARWRPWLA